MSYLQKYVLQKKQDVSQENETQKMTKHISCDCKCKFSSTLSNQKWNDKTSQFECKNYLKCKKDYSRNSSTCVCENSRYLKSVADTSVIMYDKIKSVMNTLSTKKANTTATNVSINSHNKKVKNKIDCYILNTVFISYRITINNCYYLLSYIKLRSKLKSI